MEWRSSKVVKKLDRYPLTPVRYFAKLRIDYMKLFISLLISVFIAANARSAELTIVESVPEETVYGSTLTARPLEVWLGMINGAAKTLDIEQFYIATVPGEPMVQVLSAIKAAAERGVKVRVIVDRVMMKESGAPLRDLASVSNIETRVINYKKLGGGIQHSKFFIVDSSAVYAGSQNFDWRSLKHIHEVGLKIESRRAARTFETIFEADWRMAASGGKADGLEYLKSPVPEAVTKKYPEKALLNGRQISYYAAFSPKGLKPKKFSAEIDALTGLIKKAKKSQHRSINREFYLFWLVSVNQRLFLVIAEPVYSLSEKIH